MIGCPAEPIYGANEVAIERNEVDSRRFNPEADLPYELRLKDFEMAMQDVYFFF